MEDGLLKTQKLQYFVVDSRHHRSLIIKFSSPIKRKKKCASSIQRVHNIVITNVCLFINGDSNKTNKIRNQKGSAVPLPVRESSAFNLIIYK
ncbi:hypothetical protein Ahy_B08g093824 isoform B [Arachis hypogaea]|uniref:Uncharacterized protein n=1 Tax=Arachis hypogaea TaxID=3818 RepID=A0A444Y708_ARAHY|nr:hypothetical protein Ahy_B08g093824 isoform B [Arachis hypogaea]